MKNHDITGNPRCKNTKHEEFTEEEIRILTEAGFKRGAINRDQYSYAKGYRKDSWIIYKSCYGRHSFHYAIKKQKESKACYFAKTLSEAIFYVEEQPKAKKKRKTF